jgi:branched-chain amino acid transport system permease protein
LIVIYATIGVSLVILTGWAGQISLGQYAIAGIGSAAAGGLAANHHWDFFATLIVAGLAGAAIAVVVGLPALRIQGLFLAVTTLAFAFAVQTMLNRDYFEWLLPQSGKLINRPILWGRIDLEATDKVGPFNMTPDAKYFYVCLAFLALTVAMTRSLRRNRSGRVLISARDNGRVAQAFGINLARTRLAAFALSGFIAGMAGGLLSYQNRAFADNAFPPERSIEVFILTVIDGIGSLPGAILGAVWVRGIPLLPGLRDINQIELLASGLGVLLLLNFLPGGLAEGMYRVRDHWLRRVAARRQILVPSLVADARIEDEQVPEPDLELAPAVAEPIPEVIVCPACGARVPVTDAVHHEHFTADPAEDVDEIELEPVDSR